MYFCPSCQTQRDKAEIPKVKHQGKWVCELCANRVYPVGGTARNWGLVFSIITVAVVAAIVFTLTR